MSDFEIIEPEPQQQPALRLALDSLAQRRAYEQAQLQERQAWEDAQPQTLTYLGQSNGQPLLQAAGGQPFRAGQRDSNGSLLPGLADVAIGSGVVRVGGMPRVQAAKPETPVLNEKFAILYAKTLTNTIEFWIGGDRSEPIKVAEIPRYGRSFSMENSLSQVLSHTVSLRGFQVSTASAPGVSVGSLYQPFLLRSIASSCSVSGTATLVDTTYLDVLSMYGRVIISSPGGSSVDADAALSATVVPFSNSDSGSYNDDPIEPPLFYSAPLYQMLVSAGATFYSIGASIGSLFSSGEGIPGPAIAEATASLNGSVSGSLVEATLYRAYLSVTPTAAFVTIAYDLREGGYQELILKKITSAGVSDLEEVDANDWRQSMAVKAPTVPASDGFCINTYRNQLTTNVYLEQLYALENSWLEPVTVEGNTLPFHEAVRGATSIKVKLKLRRLTEAGDSCPAGAPQDLEMNVQPLRIGDDGNITFIAACAAKD